MIKTVRCLMIVSREHRSALAATMNAFAAASNDVLSYSRQTGTTHRYALQSAKYKQIKERYGLTANYAVRACDRVAAGKRAKHFKPSSLITDKSLCRYIPATESISLSSNSGRLRIGLSLGEYQRQLLQFGPNGVGAVSLDRRGRFFLNLRIHVPDVPASGSTPLGVDLGINRIAVTSAGDIFSGRNLNSRRERMARTKASLQAKGTKGAKRLLKRLSGRERRFQKDVNHCISKRLVQSAKENDQFIVLENLKGIRSRVERRHRHFRRMLGRWAFYQLRQFIGYKAQEAGVAVRFIDPRNTSKACPYCGHLGSRKRHKFSCFACGFVGDADLVGAVNIAAKGAQANRPEVARCRER